MTRPTDPRAILDALIAHVEQEGARAASDRVYDALLAIRVALRLDWCDGDPPADVWVWRGTTGQWGPEPVKTRAEDGRIEWFDGHMWRWWNGKQWAPIAVPAPTPHRVA